MTRVTPEPERSRSEAGAERLNLIFLSIPQRASARGERRVQVGNIIPRCSPVRAASPGERAYRFRSRLAMIR